MQKVTFEQEIHTFHIDFLGHVNNGVYIQWMEIGRSKLLEAAGMTSSGILKGFVHRHKDPETES